jgi:DNA-binding LytR/AlgR family response regulator
MIVEDELPAVKILENYISKFGDIEVGSVHHNAMDAILELQKNTYDLLFLDIQLPSISGIQMLNSLVNYPAVVITTAHREYALEGYALEVVDYLLKPIAFERFTKTIAKVYKTKEKKYVEPTVEASPHDSLLSDPFIYVRSEREHVKILLKDILYVESIKNHVKIYTIDQCIVSMMSLSHTADKLPDKNFLRIHRSYIISLRHVSKFNQIGVVLGEKHLPIGRHYKLEFLKWTQANIV